MKNYAYIFDAYGTLLDIHAASQKHSGLLGDIREASGSSPEQSEALGKIREHQGTPRIAQRH